MPNFAIILVLRGMGEFPRTQAAELLVATHRYCCVCRKRCGFRIELHHIIRGTDAIENAIAVCFDCHAEIESTGPRGRRFTPEELRALKEEWLNLCRTRPEILVQAAQRILTKTGPLEALLAELEYDLVVVGGPLDQGFPQLGSKQFDRAIAVNSLAPLESELRSQLLQTYKLVNDTNRLIEKLTHLTPEGVRGAAVLRSTALVMTQNRELLRVQLPSAIAGLASALGRPADTDTGTP